MVEIFLTPEEENERRRQARRYLQLERNWTRRGFSPPEARFMITRGFDIQRARTGSAMHQFIFATIERRRRLIRRLKDLDFTERDIFNYLTEMNIGRDEGVEDLLQQFSPTLEELEAGVSRGFRSRSDRISYINEEASTPAAEILEAATFRDWTQDRLESRNYENVWEIHRINNLPPGEQERERGSRFADFRRD